MSQYLLNEYNSLINIPIEAILEGGIECDKPPYNNKNEENELSVWRTISLGLRWENILLEC